MPRKSKNEPPVPAAPPGEEVPAPATLPLSEALKSKKFLILGLIVFVLLILFFILSRNSAFKKDQINLGRGEGQVIAQVGTESLYQQDLENELSFYPKERTPEVEQMLRDKIVDDSKTLQQGLEKGIITVDETVFNSPDKDYASRIRLVNEAKKALEAQKGGISGTVITVFFVNDYVGALGYLGSQQVAFEKITALHQAVKNGEMTIDEAAENIRNDVSLAQIDESYKTNASFDFRVSQGERISHLDEFDTALWQLPAGQVSEVYLGQAEDLAQNGDLLDAYYMFGTVKEVLPETGSADYEVIYY